MAVSASYDGAPAVDDDGDDGKTDAEFVRQSYLAYLVPLATDCGLEQVLAQCSRSGASPQAVIEGVEERESFFFDETVDVYFLLRTPYQDEDRLRDYLDRLSITFQAQIVNGHAANSRDDSPSVVETLFSGPVEDVQTPLAVVSDPARTANSDEEEEEEEEEDDDDDDDEDEDEDDDKKGDVSESSEKSDDDNSKPAQTRRRRRKPRAPTRQTFCLWKRSVLLSRPRARLHGPSVSFAAVARLQPASPTAKDNSTLHATEDGAPVGPGYLRSREPAGLNLLASFGGDPVFAGYDTAAIPLRLSAQRVSRVAPAAAAAAGGKSHHHHHHLESLAPRALRGRGAIARPVVPAIHARVRFARPNHPAPTIPAVVALLEVDITPFVECEIVLTRIALALRPPGVVVDLNTATPGLALPLYCVARDHITFLYRLAPREVDVRLGGRDAGGSTATAGAAAAAAARELDVTLEAEARVQPGVCTPRLTLSWTTGFDFTPPVNPGFGATALLPPASLQRAHRPSQLSVDGMASLLAPAVSRPDALPALEAATVRSTATTIPDLGITMTFTAPAHTVYPGEEFRWTVFVVNRATTAAAGVAPLPPDTVVAAPSTSPRPPPPPRKLALIALPKRRRNDVRVLRPPSTAGPPPAAHRGRGGSVVTAAAAGAAGGTAGEAAAAAAPAADATASESVADAVLDENIVHAMHRSSLVDSTDVVCLSSADNTRVGPLAPNACHVVELRFMALRAGAVGIEAVRVVDLASQEHVDVRDLPAMVIAEGTRADAKG